MTPDHPDLAVWRELVAVACTHEEKAESARKRAKEELFRVLGVVKGETLATDYKGRQIFVEEILDNFGQFVVKGRVRRKDGSRGTAFYTFRALFTIHAGQRQ